jgi:hypothetical protein
MTKSAKKLAALAAALFGLGVGAPEAAVSAPPSHGVVAGAATDIGMLAAPKRWRNGEALEVKVTYVEPQGYTRVDHSGTHYVVGSRPAERGTLFYPSSYWRDDYPLFLKGAQMTYRVSVTNRGGAALKDIEVAVVHEYLDHFAKDGVDLPGLKPTVWHLGSLERGETWEASATVALPRKMDPGLDQTHVQIVQRARSNSRRLLWDDPQAGLFGPPERAPTPRRAWY